MSACDATCWTPVDCTVCGMRKQPRGRSVSMEMANGYCDSACEGYAQEPRAPHLWSIHDDDRAYTDIEGWNAHVSSCAECRGGDE